MARARLLLCVVVFQIDGSAHPAFDDDEVGKRHIGGGQTLADDPFFAVKPSSSKALEDPACEEVPEWTQYRRLLVELVATDLTEAVGLASEWMQAKGLRQADVLDEASKVCLLGIVSSMLLIARYSLEVLNTWESAAYLSRTLDSYAVIHPDKFDSATGHGQVWPVTDADLGRFRRQVAKLSANRTVTSWTNSLGDTFIGNAFGMRPDDEIEPNVTLAGSFKVYVYEVDDFPDLRVLAKGAGFCHDNQWGFEVALHDWFLSCPCRTDDPELADFFFVPQYTACHLNVETFSEAESNSLFTSLVSNLPYFNRTMGRDHVFVWGGGFGADGPFRSWRDLAPDSIFLMTEPELWNPYHEIDRPSFSTWKDILVPGRIGFDDAVQSSLVAPPPAERPYVGDFVGWNRPLHRSQGGADGVSPRNSLLAMANIKDLHIRQDVPYNEAALGSLQSRFCFVPRGKSAWSSRFFRVLFSGCVPVLVNDLYEPPFDSLFDTSLIVVRWPMRLVDERLLEFLRAVPMRAVEKMLERARAIRCWYFYPPSVLDFDHISLQKGKLDSACPRWRTENAFVAIQRLLRRKRRATRLPPAGFAFHVPDDNGDPVLLDAALNRLTGV